MNEETMKIRERIQEKYSNINFPDPVLEPLWRGKRPETRVQGRYAIVDQKTDTDYNVCSDLYQIIYHEQVIDIVEKAVVQMPQFGKHNICIDLLGDEGSKLKVKAVFTDIKYEISKGDFINPKIEVRSSYDLGWKYGGSFGAYRLICTNGMTIGKAFSKFSKRHLTSLEPNELRDSILKGMELYDAQVGLWKRWAEQKVSAIAYAEIWEELPFSEAEKEKIEKLPEAATRLLLPDALAKDDLTYWNFFNVLTQFNTHEIRSAVRRSDQEQILTTSFEKGINRAMRMEMPR